jgi:hypothetical protein
VALRAYVTSGCPLVTTRAMRYACAHRPHATSCGGLVARARAARSLAQHAPPVGGDLRVVARVKAADACDALQALRRRRCQRSRQRMSRRSPPYRRGRAQIARARTVAPLPLPWGCTGRNGPASGARTVTSLRTLSRPRPEQLTALLSRLEEPGAHVRREHLAIPRGASAGGLCQGCPALTSPPYRRRLSLRPSRGTVLAAPSASCDARSHELLRLVSEACLRRPRWAARDGQLPCTARPSSTPSLFSRQWAGQEKCQCKTTIPVVPGHLRLDTFTA